MSSSVIRRARSRPRLVVAALAAACVLFGSTAVAGAAPGRGNRPPSHYPPPPPPTTVPSPPATPGPSVVFTSAPAEGSTVASSRVVFNFASVPAGATTFLCELNGSPILCSAPLTWYADFVGPNTIKIYNIDANGRKVGTPAVRTFIVPAPTPDLLPPTVTITAPANGAMYTRGQLVTVAYTCTDDVAIAVCDAPLAPGQPIRTSIPGTYTFKVTAWDTAGKRTVVTNTYKVL